MSSLGTFFEANSVNLGSIDDPKETKGRSEHCSREFHDDDDDMLFK